MLNEVNEQLTLLDLDMIECDKNFLSKKYIGAIELAEKDFLNFKHKCPRCSFEFN
jgi:hypothetical protein